MEVVFYQKEDGTEPVREFLSTLDFKMRAKVARSIDQLKAEGRNLRFPASRSLGNGIMELRVSFGNDISRVLYFFIIGDTAVLTNGFVKKTQKTPEQEIKRALRYRKDFERRNPK